MESMALWIVLAVLILFIVLMLSGKFDFAGVGLTCLTILVLTGVASISQALSGFYDKNVVMLVGMFAIAGMLGQTDFVEKIKDVLLSGGGNKQAGNLRLVFSLMVIAAILAQFTTSQSSIIMIMMSFMLTICNESDDIKLSRILLPLTFVMTSWMGKLPVGSTGATTYLMLNQFIEATGETRLLDIFSLMKCTLIPGIVGVLYSALTYKWLPKKDVDISAFEVRAKKGSDGKLPKNKQIIVYVGFIVSAVGLFLAPSIGERAYFLPIAVCIVMIVLKVMDRQYFLNSIMKGPVLMCATIMGIANILTDSGAGTVIGEVILDVLGGNPSGMMIIIVFAVVTLISTSFLSNTATFMVYIPIACNVCAAAGIDPRAVVVTIYQCSLLSVITPMANTGSAICFSACNLNIRETIKQTLPGAVLCAALVVINSVLVYPF